MDEQKKPLKAVSKAENDKISRALLSWFNTWPDKPDRVRFSFLADDALGLMLMPIQGAYKVKEYVRGSYTGRYQFKLVYRVMPGNSDDKRLKADEVLDNMADWAVYNTEKPTLGQGKQVTNIEANSRAALLVPYQDGSEDHQILMTMEYISM